MRIDRIAAIVASLTLVVVACVVPTKTKAQSIARRVASAPDGKVRFTFAAREGICGHNNSIRHGISTRSDFNGSDKGTADVDYDIECDSDPVRVVLHVRDSRVTALKTYVGGRWRPQTSAVTDLGAVSARDATDYLLNLAAAGEGSPARDAVLASTLADSVTVWPSLLRVARDESRPQSVRKQAIFWVAQAAGERVAGVDRDEGSEDSEIKKQAVFALSQRRNGEAVPALIQVARDNRDPEVRRTAMFWLGQTIDPRAISFFSEILGR